MSSWLIPLQKLKFEAKSLFARHPVLRPLHRPFVWWQQYKIWRHYPGESIYDCVVGKHTEFVLDGFQGSANSFATDVFVRCQTRDVRAAHHLHSPAQVIRGVQLGLPVLITVREPVDACLSLTSRWPYVSIRQALRSYIGYYEILLPYSDGIVWSPFDTTTRDLSAAIREVNRQFGSSFDLADDAVAQQVRQAHGPKKDVDEKERRDRIKREKLIELRTGECPALTQVAERLYMKVMRDSSTSYHDHIST